MAKYGKGVTNMGILHPLSQPSEFDITRLDGPTRCDFCRRYETDRWLRGNFMGVALCNKCLGALKAAIEADHQAALVVQQLAMPPANWWW